MMEGFKEAKARFRAMLTLIRKYFSYDEVNLTGHSVFSVHPCRPPRILGSDRPPWGVSPGGLRAPNGQLFFAASRQSTGDFPVILRNSRLKFDRVLKPLESMAFVTASPAIKRSQAFSTRNPFT